LSSAILKQSQKFFGIFLKENPVPEGGFDNLPDSLLTKQIFDLTKKTDSEIPEAPESTTQKGTYG